MWSFSRLHRGYTNSLFSYLQRCIIKLLFTNWLLCHTHTLEWKDLNGLKMKVSVGLGDEGAFVVLESWGLMGMVEIYRKVGSERHRQGLLGLLSHPRRNLDAWAGSLRSSLLPKSDSKFILYMFFFIKCEVLHHWTFLGVSCPVCLAANGDDVPLPSI